MMLRTGMYLQDRYEILDVYKRQLRLKAGGFVSRENLHPECMTGWTFADRGRLSLCTAKSAGYGNVSIPCRNQIPGSAPCPCSMMYGRIYVPDKIQIR